MLELVIIADNRNISTLWILPSYLLLGFLNILNSQLTHFRFLFLMYKPVHFIKSIITEYKERLSTI